MAGLRGALVNVDFAVRSGEPCRAEALGAVVDGGAETSMLAATLRTNHVHATVLGRRPSSKGLLCRVALKARPLTCVKKSRGK